MATDVLGPHRRHKLVRLDVAYLMVGVTTMERQGFADDEEAAAEEFREVVERVARGTDNLGKWGESPKRSRGLVWWVEGRRSRRVAGDRPELRGGGASVDLEHRGSAGTMGWLGGC